MSVCGPERANQRPSQRTQPFQLAAGGAPRSSLLAGEEGSGERGSDGGGEPLVHLRVMPRTRAFEGLPGRLRAFSTAAYEMLGSPAMPKGSLARASQTYTPSTSKV